MSIVRILEEIYKGTALYKITQKTQNYFHYLWIITHGLCHPLPWLTSLCMCRTSAGRGASFVAMASTFDPVWAKCHSLCFHRERLPNCSRLEQTGGSWWATGIWFNMKTILIGIGISIIKIRQMKPSYLCNGNYYTCKMLCLSYWKKRQSSTHCEDVLFQSEHPIAEMRWFEIISSPQWDFQPDTDLSSTNKLFT